MRDKEAWEPVDAEPILPPIYEKCAGRRKKNRRKQPEESADGTRLSKHGVIMHCGYCRQTGHKRGTCEKLKETIAREEEVAEEEMHAQQAAQEDAQQNGTRAREEVTVEESEAAQEDSQQDGRSGRKRKDKGPAPEKEMQEKISHSSRGRKRKPSAKQREHVEHLMEMARKKKSKQVIDENGDIDFPVIRTVSVCSYYIFLHPFVLTYCIFFISLSPAFVAIAH